MYYNYCITEKKNQIKISLPVGAFPFNIYKLLKKFGVFSIKTHQKVAGHSEQQLANLGTGRSEHKKAQGAVSNPKTGRSKRSEQRRQGAAKKTKKGAASKSLVFVKFGCKSCTYQV